jgi:signal transduction histidine kinase
MAHFAIVTANPKRPPAGQAAHDLRNILASISLHLETLQRLAGPSGVKAADAVYALLSRGAVLCNSALDSSIGAGNYARRRRADLVRTAQQIAGLLEPSAPKDFSFDIDKNSAGHVLADPDDVFRILFNLMSNAVSVANRPASTMKSVTIRVRAEGKLVTAQVSDDGPGLPACVQSRLFRSQSKQSKSGRHGYGLTIARELAERNGGTLTLAPATKGVNFELKFAAFISVLPRNGRRYFGPSGGPIARSRVLEISTSASRP